MTGRRSFVIPRCSVHGTPAVRGAEGWVCPTCFDDFVTDHGKKSAGGVELPSGARAEQRIFETLLPNRRARRAVMKK